MNNGWRSALLAIWVILIVSAGLLVGGGFLLQGHAIADQDAVRLARSGVLLYAGFTAAGSAVVFLTLWITVSAIVLEHEKDRRQRREMLG
ncbi:hypothetical protein M3666_12705 [Curtobacterium sp. ODYSSEY 48 V2]|jgi:hypothetical protein|uniref:hypothetical protein n=1 Tax=Curtobacterium sp. ODYSSEY 48 V2 TaxID=2939561 RepID=UPI00203A57E6|nr:hypothetical protein [Curtobacterium sp. ODYSSEY 48 V2]MCM3505975.1 hypothetical protein [Curtobacterium sp. ODYSSEY 48 V2]